MSARFLAQRRRDKNFELGTGELIAEGWKDEPTVTVPDDGGDVTFTYGNLTLRMSAEQFRHPSNHRDLFALYFDAFKWAFDQHQAAHSPRFESPRLADTPSTRTAAPRATS